MVMSMKIIYRRNPPFEKGGQGGFISRLQKCFYLKDRALTEKIPLNPPFSKGEIRRWLRFNDGTLPYFNFHQMLLQRHP